ncbi:MAG: hypothetical protein NXH95_15900 [Pseudomonadaceae bacterium]|nr:hypothetical protein [Pseudomonadaceae bacterium]
MVSQTNEQALEAAIEKCLAGISSEDLTAGEKPVTQGLGFEIGAATDFNMQYAIDERLFWNYLEETHEEELNKIKRNSPNDW